MKELLDIEEITNIWRLSGDCGLFMKVEIPSIEQFNPLLEEKISQISIWQISEGGISKKFPTITSTLWTIICLGYLEKLEYIDFNGMFDFLKSMQRGDGSFTEQYTSISSQEPNILSTILGSICIFYIWDKLISRIENEILIKNRLQLKKLSITKDPILKSVYKAINNVVKKDGRRW